MNLRGTHFLSAKQLNAATLRQIFATADAMRPYATPQKITEVLCGAILGNLFFEPSTRTRISFGAAFNRLGGAVRETAGTEMTSIKKGESLIDTARVVSTYVDAIAMRHSQPGAVEEFARAATVPVINAGDGTNEHPTQAVLDVYTLQKKLGKLDGRTIAMVGDLKFGRTVHSLAYLLTLFHDIKFIFIAPPALQMPKEVETYIKRADRGHKILRTEKLLGGDGIDNADVIYMTRMQEERFASAREFAKYRGKYSLNRKIVEQHCKKSVAIMHPLPRDSRPQSNELDVSLDNNPNLLIFDQVANGLAVRMALFALILGIDKKISRHNRRVEWFVSKNSHKQHA